jgi:hypothetical protein
MGMTMTNREVNPDECDLMTIEEWKNSVKLGHFNEYDGSGSFIKDGKFMSEERLFDDVFGDIPEGATHVAWYNK